MSLKIDLKNNWKKYLGWAWLTLSFLALVIFYVARIDYLLDSDMSSEMVLADVLAKSRNIILSKNWNYSTELRLLNNQLIYELFLAISGSYHVARILSGITLYILLAISFYYLCVQAGLKKYYAFMAGFLFMPISGSYMEFVLYGLYYIPHIIISFVSMAMVLHIAKTEDKRFKISLMMGLFALAALAGMGGPRQIIVTYLPLGLVMMGLHVRGYWRGRQEDYDKYLGAYIALAGAMLGLAINNIILSKIYSFSMWGELKFTSFSFARFETIISGIMRCFGYRESDVMTFDLVRNGVCFLIIVGFAVYFVFWKKERRNIDEKLIGGYLIGATIVYILLYLFTDMLYEDRYYLPIIICGLLCIGFLMYRLEEKGRFFNLFPALLMVITLGVCIFNYKDYAAIDRTSELKKIVRELAESDYTTGYASYWNGNICTELSNGDIEMYACDTVISEIIDVESLFPWLQKADHFTERPEGKVFLLFSRDETAVCPLLRYLTDTKPLIETGNYVVYGFDDAEVMLCELSDYQYNLKADSWFVNGEAKNGSWYLYDKGATDGPVMTWYAGTYEAVIEGESLDGINIVATSELGEKVIDASYEYRDNNKIIFTIEPKINEHFCELKISNETVGTIRIDRIEIHRVAGDM